MDCARWTCPHCFAVINWTDRAKIDAHMCEGIQELIGKSRTRVMRLDTMIKTLKNPNPKRKKEKKHGT
jgi:hypothetical protein